MATDEQIKQRAAARSEAVEALAVVNLAAEGLTTEDQRLVFWGAIRDAASAMLPEDNEQESPVPSGGIVPMTQRELVAFEKTPMPFGKYKQENKTVGEVPLDYLRWISEDEFRCELQRYLASPTVTNDADDSDELPF